MEQFPGSWRVLARLTSAVQWQRIEALQVRDLCRRWAEVEGERMFENMDTLGTQ